VTCPPLVELKNADVQIFQNHFQTAFLFRDFIDATGNIRITKKQITVEFQKRAHNPLLFAAGLNNIETRIPWLDNIKLRIVLG
jgi:hypothetical protein